MYTDEVKKQGRNSENVCTFRKVSDLIVLLLYKPRHIAQLFDEGFVSILGLLQGCGFTRGFCSYLAYSVTVLLRFCFVTCDGTEEIQQREDERGCEIKCQLWKVKSTS